VIPIRKAQPVLVPRESPNLELRAPVELLESLLRDNLYRVPNLWRFQIPGFETSMEHMSVVLWFVLKGFCGFF
jgi:hypothetical protein